MTKERNMNLFIKLIIKPLRSLLKLLFNRIFYVALALVVQLAWLLIALFRLMEYSRWVTIGMQAIGFLVVLWIVNKKINPSYKLAWTMLILIFPVFGVSLYLLFGGRLRAHKKTFKRRRPFHEDPVGLHLAIFKISGSREYHSRVFSGRR